MRILYVTDGLGGGGKERQIFEIISGLIERGFVPPENLRVLCLNREAFYGHKLEKLGVRIESLHEAPRLGLGRPLGYFRMWRSFRPEIIHSFTVIGTFFSVWPRLLRFSRLIDGSIRSAPVPESRPFKIRALNRFNYRFADAIVANSRAGLASFRPPPGKSLVVHNGFNFLRMARLSPRDELKKRLGITGQKVIGMVANFFPGKDYGTFLQAAQSLLEKRHDLIFLTIGYGDLLEQNRKSILPRHRDHILFLGQQENVESWVSTFDVAVLTTKTEGISNSILEYMALGKPVIATDCAGNREVIENGVSGVLVRPGDPEELALEIGLLLQDEERMAGLGRAAALRIQSDFSQDRMISAYCQLYAKVGKAVLFMKKEAKGNSDPLV